MEGTITVIRQKQRAEIGIYAAENGVQASRARYSRKLEVRINERSRAQYESSGTCILENLKSVEMRIVLHQSLNLV